MSQQQLTPQQIADYHHEGYIIVKNFCSAEEINKLYSTALEDDAMRKNALLLNDQSGRTTKPSLWFTPGNDVFGYLTRSEKVVNAVAQLLGSGCTGLSFPFQANAERTQGRRCLGVAPGL